MTWRTSANKAAAFAAMIVMAAMLPRPVAAHDIVQYENVSSFERTIQQGQTTRKVLYLHPTQAAGSGKVPVIYLLTYLNGVSADMADLTGVAALVRDYGIWVILPQSANGSWAPGIIGGPSDVPFLSSLIAGDLASYPLDPAHVYMAGYSDGATMTESFACAHAEQVAAIGIVGMTESSFNIPPCKPTHPVSVVFADGTDDHETAYNGGLLTQSFAATQKFWAALDDCTAPPQTTTPAPAVNDGTSIRLDAYTGCAGGSGMNFYTVNGGGHTWPGTLSYSPVLGVDSRNLNATAAFWQFFQSHSR
ncbi:MAG: PHB depolymerase family esterase [Nevskia sp.]|nr:PHB depolymerase family esterase [Nevskia sp.]